MEIFLSVLESVNIIYILICNIATWLVISLWSNTSHKQPKTWMKRGISAVVAMTIGLVMGFAFSASWEFIFYGFFLQFLSWDYFFKPIIKAVQKRIAKFGGENETF